MVNTEDMQQEIASLREAYHTNKTHSGIETADTRGEIERVFYELTNSIDELEHTALKLIEKTSDVAAMDRSIPSEGEDAVSRMPETSLGNHLYDAALRVRHIQNRLNEHLYKLEL